MQEGTWRGPVIVVGRFTEHTLREALGRRQAVGKMMRRGNGAIPEGKGGSRRGQGAREAQRDP